MTVGLRVLSVVIALAALWTIVDVLDRALRNADDEREADVT